MRADGRVVPMITACGFVTWNLGLLVIAKILNSCKPDYRLRYCTKKDLKSGLLQTSGLFVCVKNILLQIKLRRSTAVG